LLFNKELVCEIVEETNICQAVLSEANWKESKTMERMCCLKYCKGRDMFTGVITVMAPSALNVSKIISETSGS
jgi:hypothetical protein